MKKKKWGILLAMVVLVIVCYLTRPSEGQYTSWIKGQIKKNTNSILVNIGTDLLGDKIIQKYTTYKDFYLFSYADTRIDDYQGITAIGIFNIFIPIRIDKG